MRRPNSQVSTKLSANSFYTAVKCFQILVSSCVSLRHMKDWRLSNCTPSPRLKTANAKGLCKKCWNLSFCIKEKAPLVIRKYHSILCLMEKSNTWLAIHQRRNFAQWELICLSCICWLQYILNWSNFIFYVPSNKWQKRNMLSRRFVNFYHSRAELPAADMREDQHWML